MFTSLKKEKYRVRKGWAAFLALAMVFAVAMSGIGAYADEAPVVDEAPVSDEAVAVEAPTDESVKDDAQDANKGSEENAPEEESVKEEVPAEDDQTDKDSGEKPAVKSAPAVAAKSASESGAEEDTEAEKDTEKEESKTVLVKFKSAAGGDEVVIHTVVLDKGATVAQPSDSVISQIPVGEGELVSYWYVEGDTDVPPTPFVFGGQAVTRDTTLLPYVASTVLVTFQSEGSPVAQQVVGKGQTATEPVAPTRSGYTFLYWSLEGDATKPAEERAAYDFSAPVEAPLELYAVWEANKVGYTVVYWVEKANLGRDAKDPQVADGAADYDYYNTYTVVPGDELALPAGTPASFDDNTAALDSFAAFPSVTVSYNNNSVNFNENLKYSYYYTTVSPKIAGDGSTVVNVYFKRKVYTVRFDMHTNAAGVNCSAGSESGAPAIQTGYIDKGGVTYQKPGTAYADTMYTFTAKYGDSIASKWPAYLEVPGVTSGNVAYNLYGWFIGNYNGVPHNEVVEAYDWLCAAAQRGGSDTVTIAPVWSTNRGVAHSRLYYIEYMGDPDGISFTDISNASSYNISQSPGEWPQYITYNGKNYKLAYGQNGYQSNNKSAQFAALEGVAAQYTDGSNHSILHAGVATNGSKHFDGSGASHTTSNDTMQYILFLYERKAYDLAFDTGGAAGVLPATLNGKAVRATAYGGAVSGVKYGESLAAYDPGTPVRDGYEFGGWYTKSDFSVGSEFSFSSATLPAAQGNSQTALMLFAKWVKEPVTVQFYDAIGGAHIAGRDIVTEAGKTIADPGIYTAGQQVAGKGEFVAWIWLLEGKYAMRFGFDNQQIGGDMKLYALWKVDGFTVKYELAGGTGTAPVDGDRYALGKTMRVMNASGIVPPEGKVFTEWLVKGSDGVTRKAGDYYTVGGSTVFVAQYADRNDVVTLTFHADSRDSNQTTPAAPVTYYVKKNSSTTLASGIFTHPYYTLDGWQDAADPADYMGKQHELAATIEVGEEDMDFYGYWTVNTDPVQITVTPQSAEKTYDGTPLMAGGYDIAGLPEGYTLHAVLEAALDDTDAVGLTDVGSAQVTVTSYTITRDSDGCDATERFTGVDTSAEGTLTVTARNIGIAAASASKAYDGESLTDARYSLSKGELADGQHIDSVAVTGSVTDVGEAANVASAAVILDGSDCDVTGNYTIEYVDGLLEVTAAPVVAAGVIDDEPIPDVPGPVAADNIDVAPVAVAADVPTVPMTQIPVPAVVLMAANALNEAAEAIADAAVPQAAQARAQSDAAAAEAEIADGATPLSTTESTWPLLNLILMILGACMAVWAWFRRRRAHAADGDNGGERAAWKRIALVATAIVFAGAGVMVWFLTETISGRMVMTDGYTLLQAVLTIGAAAGAIFLMKRREAQAGTEPEARQAA